MVNNIGYDLTKVSGVAGNYAGMNTAGIGTGKSSGAIGAANSAKETNGIEECETCRNRKYQDKSNDPGVSFKSPSNLDPSQAATAVYSHEREHYTREEDKADAEGKEVLSNSIILFTDVCPECGKTYVAGGETTTITRKKAESAGFAKEFFYNTVGVYLPKIMDVKA